MKRSPRISTTLALFGIASVGPVLYPLWLAWRTRGLSDPVAPNPSAWPGVSVVVPAYLESQVIGAKVRNALENGYLGPLEVVVVAEDEATASVAEATQARVVNGSERRGKAGALNVGVREAQMPVVILTDANAMLEPGGLEKLVRWLDDPSVGAVAGEKRTVSSGGEGAYWAFESWLKRHETRTGTTIGLSGELVALRRDEYVELPTDLAVDDLWLALDVIEQGRRIIYDPEVPVRESETPSLADEWERRTRVVSGTLDVLWRRRRMLVPRSNPVVAQLWGHRFVRSSPGPLAHATLMLMALGSIRTSRLARAFLAAHAFGALALVRQRRQRPTCRLGKLAGQVLFLQAVGIGGTIRWLRGDRPARWPKPDRAPLPDAAPPAVGARAREVAAE